MEEITIQATSGEEEGARIVPFKAVSPGGLPFSYFGKKTMRRPFTCGKELMEPDGDLRVVRMFEGSKSTSHLAVVQHLNNQTWTLTKLDKAIRLKDVKKLADRTQHSEKIQMSSREDLFKECTVSPTWAATVSLGGLKLDPPSSKMEEDVPNTIPVPQLPESLPADPSSFLERAYLETLYLSKTPLVYFVKSTLSRVRTLCKEDSGGDKQTYLHKVIDVLRQRVLSVVHLDSKYDGDKLESAVRGNPEVASDLSETEMSFLESWKTRLENTSDTALRAEITDLKVRETQLQVVVLLEILSMKVRAGIMDEKQEVQSKPKMENKKPSLVRRRRKKSTQTQQQQQQQPAQSPAENDVKVDAEDLLDILFDRLCIWQALTDVPTAKATTESGSDRLQMFCQEVIMPYFSFRLPVKSRIMLKKAQGRSTAKRPKKKQSTTTNNNQEEPEPTEPTALTQEDSFTSSAPLSQSQDTTTGDGDEFNTARRQSSSQITRGALATSTKTQYLQERRQVSVNLKNQPKSEELMSAIYNIARPNRSKVSQEFMDSKPVFANKPRKRKPRPTNKPSIQVAAAEGVLSTPAHRKRLIHPTEDQENEDKVVVTPSKKIRETDEDVHSSSVIRGTPIKGTPPLKTPSKSSPDHIMETPTSKTKPSPIEHSPIKDSPFKKISNFQDKLANRSR